MNQLLAMRAFVRVVETNSFSRAADQLSLPRSTVSKLVTDLESHLGVKLIERTTRSVAVTAEGTAYYERAARLVGEIDEADNAIRGAGLKPGGHLRIDVPNSFAQTLLIPALPDFARQFPDMTLALGISDRTVNIIGEGVHCAIRAGELTDPAMIARRLMELSYVTCAAPDYLERHGVPATPDDLRIGHSIVGYFSAATERASPLIFEKDGERLELDCRCFSANDGEGQIEMMRKGLGIGQNLKRFVQPFLDSGELVPVLENWSRPVLPFHLVYPPGRHQSAKLRAFIDWMVQRFT